MEKEGEVRNLEEVDRNNQVSYLMGQLTSLSAMHEDYILQSTTANENKYRAIIQNLEDEREAAALRSHPVSNVSLTHALPAIIMYFMFYVMYFLLMQLFVSFYC